MRPGSALARGRRGRGSQVLQRRSLASPGMNARIQGGSKPKSARSGDASRASERGNHEQEHPSDTWSLSWHARAYGRGAGAGVRRAPGGDGARGGADAARDGVYVSGRAAQRGQPRVGNGRCAVQAVQRGDGWLSDRFADRCTQRHHGDEWAIHDEPGFRGRGLREPVAVAGDRRAVTGGERVVHNALATAGGDGSAVCTVRVEREPGADGASGAAGTDGGAGCSGRARRDRSAGCARCDGGGRTDRPTGSSRAARPAGATGRPRPGGGDGRDGRIAMAAERDDSVLQHGVRRGWAQRADQLDGSVRPSVHGAQLGRDVHREHGRGRAAVLRVHEQRRHRVDVPGRKRQLAREQQRV